MGKNQKRKATCQLVKMWSDYPDKVVYRGNLKEAKKRIPPTKSSQFRIEFF